MMNVDNRVVVRYPNNGLRVRNCQSTVYPTAADLGPVKDINEWFLYLRICVDMGYRATAAVDTIINTETLLADAKEEIINRRLV